jgi:hypothetical protein
LKESATVATGRLAAFWVLFFLIGAGLRGVNAITKHAGGRATGWIEVLVLFAICYPLYFFVETAVSAAYLRQRADGKKASLADMGQVAKYPGFIPTILRLIMRCIGWLLVSAIFLILFVAVLVVILDLSHKGAVPHARLNHAANRAIVFAWILCYEGILSRYLFVMPLVAQARKGDKLLMKDAIVTARAHWGTLWIAAMVVGAVILVPFEAGREITERFVVPGLVRFSGNMVDLAFVAFISLYFCIFKTILMLQAREGELSIGDYQGYER